MKTAVWYTSTFVVIFIYLYCYLVQFIRGAEIRPQHHQPLLRSRLGAPPQQPALASYPSLGWPLSSGVHQHPSQHRQLPPLPPPPPPPEVFSDYLTPGNMAVSSSISVSSVSSAPVHVAPVSGIVAAANKPLDFTYHNYEDMTTWLKQFSASNPDLTALYSIGKSVQGE